MATTQSNVERNKTLVARVIDEVYNAGNIDRIAELFSTEYTGHGLPGVGDVDRNGLRRFATLAGSAFSEFELRVEDLIAEDEKVVVRFTWTGTHTGEFGGSHPPVRP